MNKMNNVEQFSKQEEEIDIKKIIYLLIRHWYWFAIFGIIGFMVSYGATKLIKPKYAISTSILVPEKSSGLDMKSLFQGTMMQQQSTNIYNQIELIKSYYNINQTISNLGWRVFWYKKEFPIWTDIDRNEPFKVIETSTFNNPTGLPINITPISTENYIVEVKGKYRNENNSIETIELKGEGQFGKPFVNNYFSFILEKNEKFHPSLINDNYYFIFNSIDGLTKAYQSRLNVTVKDKNSDIIIASIEGENPNEEAEFLNEVINVYIENKLNFTNESQLRSLDFINAQLAGISDSLAQSSNKFSEFRSKNNVIDLSVQGTSVMETLKELETNDANSKIQLEYFKNLLNYLKGNGELKQLVAPSLVGIQDPALNGLVLKLGELFNRRQVLSFSARENNPTLQMIDKEIAQTKSQLNENLTNLIDNLSLSISSQNERQAKINAQLRQLPKKEQQYINIQRQFEITNEIYTFLLQKKAETNIAIASTLPDVQIIDIARVETAKPMGVNRIMILALGVMTGLFLPLAYILLVNFFDDKIKTQEDIEKNTKVPVLGNIMHNEEDTEMPVFEKPKSNITESFRVLRTNLQYMLNEPKCKIISIHSTSPSEGKSFTSSNLASIISMNNNKVVLIGADLRKPRLHKIFKASNDTGLSSYLINYNTLEEIIQPTQVPNLMFIPAGPIPPNPSELLGKPEFKILLNELSTQFDYIIIDNAPIGLVTDGVIVSYLSDLNLFILRYGFSHKHHLQIINEFAERNTMEKVSIVVNDIKTNRFGYTYYKYYQYEAYQQAYYADEEKDRKKHKRVKKTRKQS